jgi:hypothetical protein
MSEEAEEFPRPATVYGIKELGRRAGASEAFIQSWRIEFEYPGSISVYVKPGTRRRIRFLQASREFWKEIRKGLFKTSVAQWMRPPGEACALIPDFKIPFSSSDFEDVGPLFRTAGADCIECPVDLAASAVLTMSRFEETLSHPRDEHGRFSACSSIAWRDGFLHRPIVDEYGLALAQALAHLLPGWQPAQRRLRVKLGHDVDEIGIPFSIRSSTGHILRRGRPGAAVRDVLALFAGLETAYLADLRRIVELSLERGIDSAVYWKASIRGPHDRGYDPRDARIAKMIAAFRARGGEMGIHPGYETFGSPERFCAEVSALRELLGEQSVGGRQDFLRWSPKTWDLWDSEGLAYDASVGYADQVGFRAGTSYPYRPWLFSQRREAELLEIPLIAMDSTLQSYMKLGADEALQKLRECVARCRAVGGVFTLLWHNTRMMEREYTMIYRMLLDELAGSDRYDWRASHDGSC